MDTPTITMTALSDIHPYANNPRNNDAAVDAVALSIQTFGFLQPIVAKPDGEILAGHTRYRAALKLGLAEVPVLFASDLDDAKARAFRLADNKVGELASWDFAKLNEELAGLSDIEDIDLSGIGFDLSAIGDIELSERDDKETVCDADEENSVSQSGCFYKLGDHILACGSSTDPDFVSKLMCGGMASVIMTDPPYGVSIGKKNAFLSRNHRSGRNTTSIINDDLPLTELQEFLTSAFKICVDVSKDDCSFFVFSPSGDDFCYTFDSAMIEAGLPLRHTIHWVKNSPTFSMGRLDYDYQTEAIHFTWRGSHRKNSRAGSHNSSVWFVDKPRACDVHPTMKPVELYVNAYLNHAHKGDIVFEPFGGSGTAIIAAEKCGLKCRAVELSRHYCDVIRKRYAEFIYGEGCDWERVTPQYTPNV